MKPYEKKEEIMMTHKRAKEVMLLATEVNKVLGKLKKIKWKWERELFDLYYYDHNKERILCINKKSKEDFFVKANGIAILGWERIEKILEKAGYYFEEPIKRVYGSEGSKYHCVIKKMGNPKPVGIGWGEDRQESVMLAVERWGRS